MVPPSLCTWKRISGSSLKLAKPASGQMAERSGSRLPEPIPLLSFHPDFVSSPFCAASGPSWRKATWNSGWNPEVGPS